MRILIVDDNQRIREIMIRNISTLNIPIEIIECNSGEEAISIFSKISPDLVLMDIVMEHMDGLKATKQILKANSNAKILIVSQLPEDEYKQEAIKNGAIGFLNKENLSELSKLIKGYLSNQKTME